MAHGRPDLNHFGIYVRDLAGMERFYTSVFLLEATDRGSGVRIKNDFVFLSGDATKHHQLVLASGRPPEAKFSTIMQISFKTKTLAEMRQTWSRAQSAGVAEMSGIDHGNSWSIYFPDPEGNTIEVYTDTPFYVPQPHAGSFDLALSDEQILAKTAEDCAQYEGFMPVEEWQARFREKLGDQG